MGDNPVCVAFGHGPDYLLALNSWGNYSWGQGGTFNISRHAITEYVIPGAVGDYGQNHLYPLPTFEVAKSVTMAGFKNELLNGKYQNGGADTINLHDLY